MGTRMDSKLVVNILKVFDKIKDPDIKWYRNANKWAVAASGASGHDLNVVCAVIAALSPGCVWERNQEDAVGLLWGVSGYKPMTYPANIRKAKRIVALNGQSEAEVLATLRPYKWTGQKSYAFYHNLRYPLKDEHVTVDRHAIAIALGRVPQLFERKINQSQYDRYSDAYREVASKVGLRVQELQAATWVHWREVNGDLKQGRLW